MFFDRFNRGSSGRGRIEENTDLRELDEFGNARQPRNTDQQGRPMNSNNHGGGMRGVSSGTLGIGFLLVAALLIYLHFTGNLKGVYDMFSSTPDENINALFQGIKDTEKLNHQNGQWDVVYDDNNIYEDSNFFKQVDKQYVVYVYSNNPALDEPFNEWVVANHDTIPIYKLETWVITDQDLNAAIGTSEPCLVIVYEKERDYKVIDSIIYTPQDFAKVSPTLDALKEHRQNQKK